MELLSPTACRVLGTLLEKELTVPATYPLTMNALLSGCNQSTGRDPVMTVDEAAATAAIDELRAAGLARLVHASHGARSVKFRQAAVEPLALDPLRRAVLTLLLLRGPQTPGELRTRSDRLHPFTSVDEVDHTLEHLAGREEPLVEQLPRRSGQKEQRWTHRLGEHPALDDASSASSASAAEPAPTIPDLVAPLAAFVGSWVGSGRGHYPTVNSFEYQEQIELRPVPDKPMLFYRSTTQAVDGRNIHGETGFMRLVGDGLVELILAAGPGVVEVDEGLLDGNELLLSSTVVAGSTTAKEVTATERRYRVDGDTLTYEVAMGAVGLPLQSHLIGTLERRRP